MSHKFDCIRCSYSVAQHLPTTYEEQYRLKCPPGGLFEPTQYYKERHMSDGLNDTKEKIVYCPKCCFPAGVCQCFNPQPGNKPLSEVLSPGIDQIPFEGLESLGLIFAEGEKKYGLDNWKKDPGNPDYNKERTRHAIRHLMLYANGDRSEPHLAKLAWFAVTTIWREKNAPKPTV